MAESLLSEYREFAAEPGRAKEALERDGVAVVRGVIPPGDLEGLRASMWSSFETLTRGRLRRDDPSTYARLSQLYPVHSMLLQHWGLGHAQYAWDVRSAPGVIAAFSQLWGADDLITSFDGVSLHLPHESTGKGFYRGNAWFHTDQRSSRNDLVSWQGAVNLYDVRPGDATTRVLTGSHRFHGEYMRRFGVDTGTADWHKLPTEEVDARTDFFLSRGCERACVLAGAGDLVLWDSRTFHHGVESQRDRASPDTRAAVYMCMTPRSAAGEAALKKRRRAFEQLRTTTHLPQAAKLFPAKPRTYGGPLPDVAALPPPVLSEAARKLI